MSYDNIEYDVTFVFASAEPRPKHAFTRRFETRASPDQLPTLH